MFSIYGMAGRVFSGSLEQLRRVPGVLPARRVAAVDDREMSFLNALDGARLPLQGADDPVPRHEPAAAPLRREAAAAYAPGGELARHRITTVAELMSHDVLLLPATAALAAAWRDLADRGVAQAPVTDDVGRLVGLVRQVDLAPGPDLGAARLADHWTRSVAERMRTPVPAVDPGTDVRRLAQVLVATGLPGLPVVDEAGRVQGYIGRGDLMRALAQDPPLDLWA